MTVQNALEIKEKIVVFLRTRGPSLPVHIAKEVGLSILFASAFLSELLSENRIKISHMRVGSSAIHYIPGQEHQLEKFLQFIKGREKEALMHLKESKFLKDRDQQPAIRVALREIKDFAKPFKKEEEIYWRYFTVKEEDFYRGQKIIEKPTEESKEIVKKVEEKIPEEKIKEDSQKTERSLGIFEEAKKPKERIKTKKKVVKNQASKTREKLFERVKEFLTAKKIEIIDIVGFGKNDLTLKIIDNGKEKLLIAYNKKRIDEQEIVKAYKKAEEFGLDYWILGLGEPSKKITNFIKAIKKLEKIEEI